MAICPHCHEQKELFAPRCPHCIQETPMGFQIGAELFYMFVQVAGMSFIFFLLWLFFG
jgi:hypothetical protein